MAVERKQFAIIWSPIASKTYDTIIKYIEGHFSDKDVQKFARKTFGILELISLDPKMFRSSEKEKNKHIVVITKQTTLYYRFKPNKKEIELLLFWDTRQNPKKIKY